MSLIYLDNNATTRLAPEVLEAMMPYLTDNFANAASNHPFGIKANDAVKIARQQVAKLIGAEENEIVFTSGATESINLIIKGIAESYAHKGRHIITLQTEHSATLDVCRYLEEHGFEISYLPVQSDGRLDISVLKSALRSDTILVSVMMVNNEIGTIQPIKELAKLSHSSGSFFMTDATQAMGKLPIQVDELDIDLMAFSGHKFYGPKGIGGAFIRQRRPNRVKIEPLQHGGGHERGFRSGTLNVPSIVGLGKACEVAMLTMDKNKNYISSLRDQLEKELMKIEGAKVNGSTTDRLFNITNIRFEGCDADALITGIENIAISNGSACTSTSIEPSHVLIALGLTEQEAYSSLRFSFGRYNTSVEIPIVVKTIKDKIAELRAMI